MLLALMQQPAAPAPPGDTTGGRPCVVVIDSVGGRAQQVEVRKGETNVFAGGGVLAHCRETGSTLSADSVAWFAGIGRFDMIGQRHLVRIRDSALTLALILTAFAQNNTILCAPPQRRRAGFLLTTLFDLTIVRPPWSVVVKRDKRKGQKVRESN